MEKSTRSNFYKEKQTNRLTNIKWTIGLDKVLSYRHKYSNIQCLRKVHLQIDKNRQNGRQIDSQTDR